VPKESVVSFSEPGARRLTSAWRLADVSRDLLLSVLSLVAILVLWEGAVRVFHLPNYIVPAPIEITRDTFDLGSVVVWHTLATLRTVLLGFLLSVVISLPLAIAITASATAARTIYPALVLLQSVPKVAIAPILIIALGANELPRVVVTFLVAFFPLVVAAATGLQSVPAEFIELWRSLRVSRWKLIWRISLPYAVPFVFGGLKVAIALSVVGAVVGEFVAANQGLGYLIATSMAFFKTPVAWGAMIILSVMGIALFQAVVLVERVFFPWSTNTPLVAG
jgi:NitT/TauT family transport system permease protein